MKMKYWHVGVALGAALALPASAQDREIEYPKGSLAYEALMSADYGRAERQLRSDHRVRYNDPAKLINYGLVLANTGRLQDARKSFETVLAEEEVDLIMSDGSTMGSHDIALQGLEMVKSKRSAQR
jgi:hypothetical protein